MKETILRSKKFPNLILQIFNNNEFGMLGDNEEVAGSEKEFFTDNASYAYEVLKLLKEADKRDCFVSVIDNDKEEILI